MIKLHKHTRRAITFCPNGRIDISAGLACLLNLKPGDVIDIFTDGYSYEYYIYIRDHTTEHTDAQCFLSNKRGKHFRTCSRRLYKFIADACSADGTIHMPAGGVYRISGKHCVSLITHAYFND